jgi:hypothetical protein
MKRRRLSSLALAACLAACLAPGCAEEAPTAASGDLPFYADQQYYPTENGTTWTYRIDTISARGVVTSDIGRRLCRIVGPLRVDSTDYVLQVNENTGAQAGVDSIYIRKDADGVFLSSPQMQTLGQLAVLQQLGIVIPKEFLVVPQNVLPGLSWSIVNIEYNQIPIFPIWFRVHATYLTREDVQLGGARYKGCAKVRMDISARFPNPENPSDFLNPLLIEQTATFWLSKPFGIVAGDGSESVFTMLRGQLPLTQSATHMRHEVIGMNIVQPQVPCP